MMQRLHKRGLVGLLGLLLTGTLHAQQPRPTSTKSLAWRLTKTRNTVYLLGSVHLLKKQDYPLPPAFEKAYRDSAVMVLEIDPKELADPKIRPMTMKMAKLPDGQFLFQKLPKPVYDKTKAAIEKMGGKMSGLEPFKPWFIAVTITAVRLDSLGYKQKYGMDAYFSAKAVRDKKQTLGLETTAFQLGLFDKLSEADQVMFLKQSLEDIDNIEKEAGKLLRAWRSGDTKKLSSIIFKNMEKYPKINRTLFIERNKTWVPKIEEFLKRDKNVVVIVGAGHLVGKQGVINLLQLKGYRAVQL